MPREDSGSEKIQLDKSEREDLEDVIVELREVVEADIAYRLKHSYDLEGPESSLDSANEPGVRDKLLNAIEREDDDKAWEQKFERYVMGVGYTIVNRLTALRCMEVRGFIDRPVTQFSASGTTPAAEKIEAEEFLGPDEAILEAYNRACESLRDEIEILFDSDSPYSLIEIDVDIYEQLCQGLDEVPSKVWRADDVLGWVYEYYNTSKLDELRRKGDYEGLEPEDVPAANQFYTPHWIVRMLTDNSLTKMYLESKGELFSTVENQKQLTEFERKHRETSLNKTPSLDQFSTYLVPAEAESDTPDFDNPEDIRVIDPACGSGHFLLYAYDVLERIWSREKPEMSQAEISKSILKHNLFGIDLDLRACQLAAFNLYLKARGRAERDGIDDFEVPEIGIVCADAKIAQEEPTAEVFEAVSNNQPDVQSALEDILESFHGVHGLGSLLDVRGTLEEKFTLKEQPTLMEAVEGPGSLSTFLENLHEEISDRRDGNSFVKQDLKSFLRLLVILSQDYDVALMNPPYGSRNRMPDVVKEYVKEHYSYKPEYYINFFEVCDNLVKENGRIGMLVPRTFMFKQSYQDFRDDFIGSGSSFEFLAEFGLGVLDNATVRTAGTVVRSSSSTTPSNEEGEFYRLHDIQREEKEEKFLNAAFAGDIDDDGIQRHYTKAIDEFSLIPGSPISYWVPTQVRQLYDSPTLFENRTDTDQESLGVARAGAQTSDDDRFLRLFWEIDNDFDYWVPYAKGGEDAWILPRILYVIAWGDQGTEIKRYPPSIVPNEQYYFSEVLAFTRIKEGGKRFGYLHPQSIFGHSGFVYIPDSDIWNVLSYSNSNLYTYLMIAQTTNREWNVGEISKIPWDPQIAQIDELEAIAKEAAGDLLSIREHDFKSPYYTGPLLFKILDIEAEYTFTNHPHQDLKNDLPLISPRETYSPSTDLSNLTNAAVQYQNRINQRLNNKSKKVDEILFNHFDIREEDRTAILREIALRTNEDPLEQLVSDESRRFVDEISVEEAVKDLILHLCLEIVQEDDDGVVLVGNSIDDEKSLLDRVINHLIEIFGDHAEERIPEIDRILGDEKPEDGAYPNIESWLKHDLFDYHLQKFENTPIIWRLTTNRFVSDSRKEGFGCIVDYYQLDSSLFDRIESRYIDPIKSEYRNRRNAADQRRSDSSLPTAEQAQATEEYRNYEQMLSQVDEFQAAALQLSSPQFVEFDGEIQDTASALKTKVQKFRERTTERLQLLDDLVDEMDPEEFEDHFSPTFLERVNKNRDEWIDALQDLETACEAYSKDDTANGEAHFYDLFVYFDDLVGTTHYGSNGIFFMNYYFSKGEDLLDDGEPREGLKGETRILAELAAETDKDVELGEEIKEGCIELSNSLPSDWQERALHEVLASGYTPIKKHGVATNIQPLAEQKLVPESVEDKVL